MREKKNDYYVSVENRLIETIKAVRDEYLSPLNAQKR